MPSGRFVSGVTQTSVGEVAVIGVCIPWLDRGPRLAAGTNAGGGGRTMSSYLAGLTEVLERVDAKRLIVMGDFNQVSGREAARPVRFNWHSKGPSRRTCESLRRILPSRDARASTTLH